MKLDKPAIDYICNAIATAKQLNQTTLIIEPNRVRSLDDSKSIFICSTDNVPAFEFGSVGFNRIPLFDARIKLCNLTDPTFTADVVVEQHADMTNYIRSFSFSSKKTKVEYRCANPNTIKAVKSVPDTITHTSVMSDMGLSYLTKGSSAMDTTSASLLSNPHTGDLVLQLVDINGDKLTHQLEAITSIDGTNQQFEHWYPVNQLQALFKYSSREFSLTSKGFLISVVNGLTVYLKPIQKSV